MFPVQNSENTEICKETIKKNYNLSTRGSLKKTLLYHFYACYRS